MTCWRMSQPWRKVPPPARAIEGALASAPGANHISEPMAGSPLQRQRKLGVRDENGNVIAFPRMPRVADLPSGWRHWSPAEKAEHLLGMSLDQMHDTLSWQAAELDPYRLSVQWQVARVVLMIGTRYVLDSDRERRRSAALEELACRFNGEHV